MTQLVVKEVERILQMSAWARVVEIDRKLEDGTNVVSYRVDECVGGGTYVEVAEFAEADLNRAKQRAIECRPARA